MNSSKHRWMSVWVAPGGMGTFIYMMKYKSEVLDILKTRIPQAERLTKSFMEWLRMDRGGEQTGKLMMQELNRRGTKASFTAPNKSAGPAEAAIRVFQDGARAMLSGYREMHGTSADHLMFEALHYARDCRDMMPHDKGLSSYETREGRPAPLHKMHKWGTTVVSFIAKELRRKNDNHGRVGRLMGFARDGDGYRVYDPKKGTIFHSGSVRVHDFGTTTPVETATLESNNKSVLQQASVTPTVQPGPAVEVEENPQPAVEEHQQQAAMEEDDAPPAMEEQVGNGDVDVPRQQRVRHPVQPFTVGHDVWQSLATTHKDAVKSLSSLSKEQIAKVKRGRTGLVLKSDSDRQRARMATIKMQVQRTFLDARRGGQRSRKVENVEQQAAKQKGVADIKVAIDYIMRKRGGGRVGLQFDNTPNRPSLPTGMLPLDEAEALDGEDGEYWSAAIDEERKGLEETGAMEVVPRSEMQLQGRRSITAKMVLDIQLRAPTCDKVGETFRTLPDGRKVRYKARLVARGFMQQAGVDFNKTYAPTPQIDSIRLILPYIYFKGWKLIQMDVKQAFLQSHLPEGERVFLEPTPGDPLDGAYVYKLLKCLYGLRQASHAWSQEVNKTLRRHGFTPTDGDPCVFLRHDGKKELECVLIIHVDDFAAGAPDGVLWQVAKKLKAKYTMTQEDINYYLKIHVDMSSDGKFMAMSQPQYAREIVEAMGLIDCNPVSTPMEVPLCKGTNQPITEEEVEFMAAKAAEYGTVTGMLTHLANMTRPDLAYSVGQLQRYASCPRKKHWEAMKRIVRYLKGTMDLGLLYRRDCIGEGIIGAADSDWASDPDDRKSTSGYVFTYAGAAFAWKSKKQGGKQHDSEPARATATAELRALDLAVRQGRWLRKMHMALQMPGSSTIPIYEDNEACKNIANGSQWSNETKHVATQYFAVRGDVSAMRVSVHSIASAENPSDFFTKPLKPMLFHKFRKMLGIEDVSGLRRRRRDP